ncbi:MAG: GNAT family N-acetyltransferase [Flavobacteriales bacterium]|nr:MAG: GNAT family N-acetyltransferase [Flavobacteriales bacterium]
MIRSAKISEISDILKLTEACAKAMIEQGIYQWNEHYPSRSVFEKDVREKSLYALIIDGQLLGTVVISPKMDQEYVPVKWLTPNQNNLYIHRLAVAPEYQGKGYAQRLMDFAERHAREKGYVSVRLDTFSQNRRNQIFYETRGYQRLGDIFFPKQSEYPFHCYELPL